MYIVLYNVEVMLSIPLTTLEFCIMKFKIYPVNAAVSVVLGLTTLQSHAQFASGEYEVYGRLNLAAYNIGGYNAGQPTLNKISSVGSRIGFTHEKDLGDGLSSTFKIEGGVTANSGTGDIGSRETSVGLKSSNWGWLRAGYMLTPLDDLHSIAGPGYLTSVTNDNFSGFWANGYSNMFSNGGTAGCSQVAGNTSNNTFGFDNRYGNSARYDSPKINGFTAAGHISLSGIQGTDGCSPYAWSSKLQYENGALKGALAYNIHHDLRGAGLNDDILMLAVGYQINSQYNIGSYLQQVKYANPGKKDLTQSGFGIRGRAFYGPSTFELGWYHAGEGQGNQTPTFSGISVGSNTSADIYLLGYRRQLSKGVELWSQIALLQNGSSASYDLGGGGVAGTAATLGAAPRTIAVGMKYDF